MIAIIATYFQRQMQLEKTLASFCQYKDEDFVFIVVDDGSPEEIRLPEVPFDVEIVRVKNKTWRNTCVPFNLGFIKALKYDPDIVIIQNVECLHSGDILTAARKVTDETVLSFACYSLGHGEEPGITLNNKAAEFNDESSWYNHSVYRPFGFHFCNAITAANLRKLNGMDERLWEGIAYEDNMFKHQIQNLGLRFEFIDDPFVYHQWHDRPYEITEELVKRNYTTYLELQKSADYRAVHVITPDLS
jgi:glycosyltransferase involved in cell wall biosynthesis